MFLLDILKSKQKKQTLKVTMLGYTGVGKTSLLCAMYDQFHKLIGKTNLQLTPDEETKTILLNRLQELKNSAQGNGFKIQGGIRLTEEPKTYSFSLGKTGENPSIDIQFQDYSGEDLIPKENDSKKAEKKEQIKQYIEESVAIIIAIDTPALIEKNGKWHDEFNQPDIIYNYLTTHLKNLDTPKLIIFAPVKCEKYLRNSQEQNKLITTIQQKYKHFFDYFRNGSLNSNLAVVMTPVQTLGSIDYAYIEEDENEKPTFYFSKVHPKDNYSPKNSEQPLRYLLRFLLKLYLQNRKMSFLESIFSFMQKDQVFIDAIKEFSFGCNIDGTCIVFQGENLLTIN
ncbi:MAG: hypothetical protein Kow0091_15860 [Geminocystis sp.]